MWFFNNLGSISRIYGGRREMTFESFSDFHLCIESHSHLHSYTCFFYINNYNNKYNKILISHHKINYFREWQWLAPKLHGTLWNLSAASVLLYPSFWLVSLATATLAALLGILSNSVSFLFFPLQFHSKLKPCFPTYQFCSLYSCCKLVPFTFELLTI